MEDWIIRRKKLREIVPLSDSQIDRLEKLGTFPLRRQITARVIGWSYIEVQAWINDRLHVESKSTAQSEYSAR